MRWHLPLQTLFILFAIGSAFPQAAAEAALANGHAAAASSKTGAILTDAINKANQKVSNSLKTTSPSHPTGPVSTGPAAPKTATAVPTRSANAAGNGISIQHGATSSSTIPTGSTPPAKPLSIQGGQPSNAATGRGAKSVASQSACAPKEPCQK
jgi:hypothetical protein